MAWVEVDACINREENMFMMENKDPQFKTEKKNPANPINRVRVVKSSGLPTVRIVSRKASA